VKKPDFNGSNIVWDWLKYNYDRLSFLFLNHKATRWLTWHTQNDLNEPRENYLRLVKINPNLEYMKMKPVFSPLPLQFTTKIKKSGLLDSKQIMN
jgi:hypothetical protein